MNLLFTSCCCLPALNVADNLVSFKSQHHQGSEFFIEGTLEKLSPLTLLLNKSFTWFGVEHCCRIWFKISLSLHTLHNDATLWVTPLYISGEADLGWILNNSHPVDCIIQHSIHTFITATTAALWQQDKD